MIYDLQNIEFAHSHLQLPRCRFNGVVFFKKCQKPV